MTAQPHTHGIAVPQHVASKPQAAGLVAVPLPPSATPNWVVSTVTGSPAATSAPLLLEILDAELRRREPDSLTA